MTTLREAAQMALDALEFETDYDTAITLQKAAIQMLRAALAQPEQEPVAFYVYKPTLPIGNLGNVSDGDLPWIYDQDPSSGYSARMLVYTAPPQRDDAPAKAVEWQGLTDDEQMQVAWSCGAMSADWLDFARAIEAKLREKNSL